MADKGVRKDLERAIQEETEFENRPDQVALRKQLKDEEFDQSMRALGGGLVGLTGAMIGGGIARKLMRKQPGDMPLIEPVAGASLGGYVAAAKGNYPAHEAQRKAKSGRRK